MKRIKWFLALLRLRPNLWVHRIVTIASLVALVYVGVSISFGAYYDDSVVGRWIHKVVTGESDFMVQWCMPPCYGIKVDGRFRFIDVNAPANVEFKGERRDELFAYMQGHNRAGFLAPVRVQTAHRFESLAESDSDGFLLNWVEFPLEDGFYASWDYWTWPDQQGFIPLNAALIGSEGHSVYDPYLESFRVYWPGYLINLLALAGLSGIAWSLGWTPAMFREQAGLIRHRRRYRKIRSGKCPDCGYDISGTRGRCSDCGWGHDYDGQEQNVE